ncbi:MAG: pyruvate kinase [Anaerolineales bacterium]|nr:pyruvate kinase [Anaerolineales bacterium]
MTDNHFPLKKTKIVCTIGPASQSQQVLEQMMVNGMNIARINFAHGGFEGHRQVIRNIRMAAEKVRTQVAIFGDLPGPKMRIGKLAEEPIQLEREQPFILQTGEIVGNEKRVSMSFERLPYVVKPGDYIFLNDGFIQLKVDEIKAEEVHCIVKVGGELRSHKGLNLPGIELGISAFTPYDQKCLEFAAEQQLDGVSQSFVESAADILAVREAAHQLGYDPFIIAKIERSGAIDHISDILKVTDGIMVARGDLGVEIAIEKVAAVQKQLIVAANLQGRPVITATHMLESMTSTRRPTRAEVTDVANAILNGTDCVMLSGETAIGSFPDEAVAVMARIAQVTETSEESIGVADLLKVQQATGEITKQDLISFDIFQSTLTLNPVVLFVPSASGDMARRITRFRLKEWIVAPCLDKRTSQKLQFSFGILPQLLTRNPLSWPYFAQEWLKDYGLEDQVAMVVEGGGTLKAGDTTRIDIINLA